MKKHLFLLVVFACPLFVFSQNVGIGITNPIYKLDVEGKIQSTSSGGGLLHSYNGTLLGTYIGGGGGWIGTFSNHPFHFFTDNSSPLMTLTTAGYLGIGTQVPSEKLHINGNLKVAGIISGVTDPVDAQDAATKAYVDANSSSATYTIGLSAEQGGYIFWVSADGKHGLVAETVDQSSQWYDAQDDISDPNNHSADGANFRDWRMPTLYELQEMYLQKDDIGGFSNDNYWSSTESSPDNAWLKNFGNGNVPWDWKGYNYDVRAVRAF